MPTARACLSTVAIEGEICSPFSWQPYYLMTLTLTLIIRKGKIWAMGGLGAGDSIAACKTFAMVEVCNQIYSPNPNLPTLIPTSPYCTINTSNFPLALLLS